jgi:hypothetical protein
MSRDYEKQSFFHRIKSQSGDPKYAPQEAKPHPELYPYIATEMGPHLWDIQAVVDTDQEKLETQAKDRVWRSRCVCYLVLAADRCIQFSPSFQRGTLTDRPRGGWILRVSAKGDVEDARKQEAERLASSMANQLDRSVGPHMLLEEPGHGVSLCFSTVVVKMDAILATREWTWASFLDFCASNGLTPLTDGRLVAIGFMSGGEMGTLLDHLTEHGLQCEEYPVDYYIINAGDFMLLHGPKSDPAIFQGRRLEHQIIATPHDHEIRLSIRNGGVWAQMEGV